MNQNYNRLYMPQFITGCGSIEFFATLGKKRIGVVRGGRSLNNQLKAKIEKLSLIHIQMCIRDRACGTGACAVAVASILNGLTKRKVTVKLLGGDLMIEWNEENGHVFMTGPAEVVFDGKIDLSGIVK